MKDIIVNWVKEDEELLEPYEWDEDDDLEIISRLKGYLVDQDTLHDFIYGCINLYEKYISSLVSKSLLSYPFNSLYISAFTADAASEKKNVIIPNLSMSFLDTTLDFSG